jgi:hypothetical protein
MAVFTILGLLSTVLSNARVAETELPDAGMVAAYLLSVTNQLTEDCSPEHSRFR